MYGYTTNLLVIWVCLQVLFITVICADNETPDCTGKDTKIFKNPTDISLTHNGEILIFNGIDISEITARVNNDFKKLYIDVNYNRDLQELSVSTTDEFSSYADEQVLKEIFLIVTYRCPQKTKKWFFYQGFDNSNNFAPTFAQDRYEFSVPLPLYKGFELTMFQKITATDKDLSGNVIQFSSENSNDFMIDVRTSTVVEGHKTYQAILEALQVFTRVPSDRIEFTITATDNGSPPKSSHALVVITPNNDTPSPPRFEKFLYEGSLDDDFRLAKIEFPTLESLGGSFTIRKFGDDAGLFSADTIENLIVIKLAKTLTEEDVRGKAFLKFNLEASRNELNETGNTGVVVSVPRTKPENFFAKNLYSGILLKNGELQLEEIIFTSNGGIRPTFSILNSESGYFSIQSEGNVVKLTLNSMESEFLKDKNFISAQVVAKIGEKILDTTEVIVDIPKNVFYFEKSIYEGFVDAIWRLQLEPIHFNAHAYSEDIQFSLKGYDAGSFNFTHNGNEITVILANGLSPANWKDTRHISFFIEASKSDGDYASAVVSLDLPESEVQPEFTKSLYQGEISLQNVLAVEDIIIVGDTLQDYTVFELMDNLDIFELKKEGNRISIVLKRELTPEERIEMKFFLLTVIARNIYAEGRTAIAVTLESTSSLKVFKNVLAQGRVVPNQTLQMAEIPLEDNWQSDEFKFVLEGDESGYFEIVPEIGNNRVNIILKGPLSQDIFETTNFLTFVLEGHNPRRDINGSIAIVLQLPGRSGGLGLQFSKKLFKGQLDDSFELKMEEIRILGEDIIETELILEGPDANLFNFRRDESNVKLSLKEDISEVHLDGKSYLELSIVAMSEGSRNNAIILIDIPKICEIPTTTPCPAPDPCPTPEPPSDVPQFSKGLYKFRAQPNFMGSFGFVSANIEASSAQIIYSIYSDNDDLNAGLSIQSSTGELYITSIVSSGVYAFQVTAENAENHSKGHSLAYLEIDSLIQCGNETHVANALIIKNLEEGYAHQDILNTKLNDCQFEITGMAPNDEEYFQIDAETHMLTSIKIDREDEIFSQMIIPQVQVKLRLTCSESPLRRKRALQMEIFENRSNVLTNGISFTRDTTMLTVIIVDINDNAPEFLFPPKNNTVIGYPEPMISSELLPEYLYKVEATDKDEGLNATVRYKMDANAYFNIEPETGIIYPFGNRLDIPNVLRLRIYATDRDGAADGLTTSIVLKVKRLSGNHLTLLTFDFGALEDIHDLDYRIRQRTGIDLIVLKQAIVPYFNASEDRELHRLRGMLPRQASANVIVKVWTYAFNQDEDPIVSSDMERQLAQLEDEFGLSTESYEEVRFVRPFLHELGQNVIGYIVALSLLSVFLAGLIGFLSWWFYFRHLNYRNATPTSSASVTPPFASKPTSDMEYKPYPKNGDTFQAPNYQKRESFKILGMTTNETSDDHHKILPIPEETASIAAAEADACSVHSTVAALEVGGEEQSAPKPRTTVTFNEMVERIHIVTDDGGKRDADDGK